MTVHLDIYYDFSSPFCYVARAVVGRLVRRYDLTVNWLPFEVIDYLPPSGAMPQNPAFVRRAEARETAKLAAAYELTIQLRDRLLNSNLALRAVEFARDQAASSGDTGLFDRVHGALFDAFYRDQRDIAHLGTIVEVAVTCGLDGDLEIALSDGCYGARVARSRSDAHALGVVAVPTFLAGGHGIVGIPTFSAFEQLIETAMTSPRELERAQPGP